MLVCFLRIIDLVRWNALLQFYRECGGPLVCRARAVCRPLHRRTREGVRVHLPVGHYGGEQSRRVTSRAKDGSLIPIPMFPQSAVLDLRGGDGFHR
jgi:hypothetical protein